MILEYNKDSTLSRFFVSIVENNELDVQLRESNKTILKTDDFEITDYSAIESILKVMSSEKVGSRNRVHISDSVCISCEG